MGKLDSRTDDGILVGYSCYRKAYKCYNFRLRKIVEAIDVTFDESAFLKSKTRQKDVHIPDIYDKHRSDDEKDETEEVKADDSDRFTFDDEQYFSPSKSTIPTKNSSSQIHKNHLEEFIIGDINSGVEIRSRKQQTIPDKQVSLLSLTEPKNVDEAIKDEYWVNAMKEELSQIEKNIHGN